MKKVIFTLVFTLALISCGTTNFVNRAKKLELGMTKKEVISVMGNDFRVISASQTPEGNIEVLRYIASIDVTEYVIYLLDGKLVEWHEDIPNAHHPHPHKGRRVHHDNRPD